MFLAHNQGKLKDVYSYINQTIKLGANENDAKSTKEYCEAIWLKGFLDKYKIGR